MIPVSSPRDTALLNQLVESYQRAHPHTPYRAQDLLNATLEISRRAQRPGGIGALYPEQADFIRTVLNIFGNYSGVDEVRDAAGNQRFHLVGADTANVQLALQKLSQLLDLPLKKATPYYNGFAALADLNEAIATAQPFPDGRVLLTPQEYGRYAENHVAAWLSQFEPYAGPLSPDAHGMVMIQAESAKQIRKVTDLMARSGRDSDYTRCRQFLHFAADRAPQQSDLGRLLHTLDGAILYSMKDRPANGLQALDQSPDALRDALTLLRPDLAQHSHAKGPVLNIEPGVLAPVLRQLQALDAALQNEGPEAASQLFETIRAQYRAEKPRHKPVPVIQGPAQRAVDRDAELDSFMQPLAAMAHTIEIGKGLSGNQDGTIFRARPTEGVRMIRFASKTEAVNSGVRLQRLLQETGGVHVKRDSENQRYFWLVVPEETNRKIHQKMSGIMDRFEQLEKTFHTDRPQAEGLRQSLLEEMRALELVRSPNAEAALAPSDARSSIAR